MAYEQLPTDVNQNLWGFVVCFFVCSYASSFVCLFQNTAPLDSDKFLSSIRVQMIITKMGNHFTDKLIRTFHIPVMLGQ